MEYKIVRKYFIDELEHEVNALMMTGWIPIGGISYGRYPHSQAFFCQAMTRTLAE